MDITYLVVNFLFTIGILCNTPPVQDIDAVWCEVLPDSWWGPGPKTNPGRTDVGTAGGTWKGVKQTQNIERNCSARDKYSIQFKSMQNIFVICTIC